MRFLSTYFFTIILKRESGVGCYLDWVIEDKLVVGSHGPVVWKKEIINDIKLKLLTISLLC